METEFDVHAHFCACKRKHYDFDFLNIARKLAIRSGCDRLVFRTGDHSIAEKRNSMLEESMAAGADWIVNFDDDDWKGAEYVRAGIGWCLRAGRPYIVRGEAWIYDLCSLVRSYMPMIGYGSGHWILSTDWLREHPQLRYRRHGSLRNKSDHELIQCAKATVPGFKMGAMPGFLVGRMIRFRHLDNVAPVRKYRAIDDRRGAWLRSMVGDELAMDYLKLARRKDGPRPVMSLDEARSEGGSIESHSTDG